MYIDYDDFDEFSSFVMNSEYKMFSPGWVSKTFGTSRQLVNFWINKDIITAHRCNAKKGETGHYVLISEEEYPKIIKYMNENK